MNTDDLTVFARLVRAMREAQRAYFRHRRNGDLAASKDYERAVDERLAQILGPVQPEAERGLFEGES